MLGTRTRLAIAAAAISAVGMLAAACSSSSSSSSSSSNSGSGSGSKTSAAPQGAVGAPVSVTSSPLGSILVDSKGKTIYFFAPDSANHSTCNGMCLQYWPIVSAPATLPTSVSGVTAKLGSLTRSDGSHQLTVAGLPVYTYVGDSGPGTTKGQGLNLSGGLWWVVSPAGTPVTSGASSSSSTSSSSSSSGGYGNGY
jgi:predicted lipoprotein with Yx(FWY)xxD motif